VISANRKPGTSRDTPTTVTRRAGIGGSSLGRDAELRSCSRRNVSPTPLPFGHNAWAIDSETMTTGWSPSRSAAVNERPRRIGMPNTSKYSGETNL
jgi:hypothetical protein